MQSTDSLTPTEFIDEIAANFPKLTLRETRRLLDHARAWATVFFDGEIPPLLASRLQNLEALCRC
jgi:hypothetical protein